MSPLASLPETRVRSVDAKPRVANNILVFRKLTFIAEAQIQNFSTEKTIYNSNRPPIIVFPGMTWAGAPVLKTKPIP